MCMSMSVYTVCMSIQGVVTPVGVMAALPTAHTHEGTECTKKHGNVIGGM